MSESSEGLPDFRPEPPIRSLPSSSPGLLLGKRRVRFDVLAALALAVLGVVLFGEALGHGFTTWDDNVYVTENPRIHDLSVRGVIQLFTTSYHCNYHPLTSLTYRVEYALVGFQPWLYHLSNIVIHIGSAILAFILCRLWLAKDGAAFLAALLFLIHPLRAESVAWVGERKDVLCTFFCLAAILAYSTSGRGAHRGRYRATWVFFVLALLSKVMAVTLPVVLLFLLAWERKPTGAEVRRLVPLFVLSGVFTVLGIVAQASEGAVKELHGQTWLSHLLTLPAVVALYAEKLLVPVVLSPRYIVAPVESLFDGRFLLGSAILALAAWGVWRSFRVRGIASLGLGFFFITWAPVSGIVPSSTLVADRYLYLPSLGLFAALSGVLFQGLQSRSDRAHRLSRAGIVAALIFAAWCMILTPLQVSRWRDSLTLWNHALRQDPHNSVAHNQIATLHFLAGRYAEAASAATEAARCGLTDAPYLYNLCVAYRGLGDKERELATAREILKVFPDFYPAAIVEARHLRESGQHVECEALLEALQARFPDRPDLLAARAELRVAEGQLDEALLLFLGSLERNPHDPEVRLATSVVLYAMGYRQRAVTLAEETVRACLTPGDARDNPHGSKLSPGARENLQRFLEFAEQAGDDDFGDRLRKLRSSFDGTL